MGVDTRQEGRSTAGSARHDVVDRKRRILASAVTLAVVGYCVLIARGVDSVWFTHWIYLALLAAATSLVALRAVRVRHQRAAWACLAFGLASWTSGWVVYFVADELGRVLQSPGAVDVLWLLFYPFALAALILLATTARQPASVLVVDTVSIMFVTAGLLTAAVLPYLQDSESLIGAERLVVISYQVGDGILLSISVVVVAMFGRQAGPVWVLLAAAILTLCVGDAAWSFQAASGAVQPVMNSNAIYPLTMLLWVAAAWQPRRLRRPDTPGATLRVQIAVLLAVAVGIGLLVTAQWLALPTVSVVLVALGLTCAMHRIWRALALSVRTTRAQARDRDIVDEFGQALTAGELTMHFQPLVDLRSGDVRSAEALLRWQARQPDEFLPAVERSPLIRNLTDFVLDRSLAALASWRAEGHDLGLAVNLATANLLEPDLPARVEAALRRHGVPSGLLTLEITESAAIGDDTVADAVVTALAGSGVSLSIDDFGTGHSSIMRIARFPISELKIDRSFVGAMSRSELPIVETSIGLAHGLGLRVVAEGIEDQQTLERLRDLGCDLGQGYHLSRPIDRIAFLGWLDVRPDLASSS